MKYTRGDKQQVTSDKKKGNCLAQPVTCHLLLVAMLISSPLLFAEQGNVLDELERSVATCSKMSERMNGYDVVFRRDPMRPLLNKEGDLVSSSGMSGGLSVQGIIWSDEHPLAVVDNELFGVGAVVGPYTITQIQQAGVVATRNGRDMFIPLDRGIEPLASPSIEPPSSPSPEPSADASESAPPVSPAPSDTTSNTPPDTTPASPDAP